MLQQQFECPQLICLQLVSLVVLEDSLSFSSCKGWKSVEDVPKLVDDYMNHKLKLDEFITHNLPLDQFNVAFDLLKSGKRYDRIHVWLMSFVCVCVCVCVSLCSHSHVIGTFIISEDKNSSQRTFSWLRNQDFPKYSLLTQAFICQIAKYYEHTMTHHFHGRISGPETKVILMFVFSVLSIRTVISLWDSQEETKPPEHLKRSEVDAHSCYYGNYCDILHTNVSFSSKILMIFLHAWLCGKWAFWPLDGSLMSCKSHY